jgi:O-antigen/teichoic acid export membrane protein
VSIRRSLAWMMASQGVLFILQFAGSVVLARLLTPYEMGVYTVAAAIMGILGIVQALGLRLFIVREAEIKPDLMRTVFTINALLAVLLSAALVGLSELGGAFMHEPGVQRVLLVLSSIPLIGIFEFLPASNVERNGEFRTIALMNLLRAAASTLVTVSLAFTGFSYMSIVWGGVAGDVAAAAGYMIAGSQFVCFRLGLTSWRRILNFGMQQMVVHGVNTVSTRLSDLLLGRLLGLSALGLYGRAGSLSMLLWYNIHMVVARVVLVDLAGQRRQRTSLRDAYLRTTEVIISLLWPGFAGLAILARPLILVVYGPKWLAAAPPLAALAVASIVRVSITMSWEVFIVSNETDRQARFEGIRAAFGLALFTAGCFVNLTVAAVARIGEAVFSVVLYRPHIQRMTDTRQRDFLPIYWRGFILTVAACTPALVLMSVYRWSPHIPVALTFGAIVVGLVAWLGTMRLMNHVLFGEVHRLLAKVRQSTGLASGTATPLVD